MTALRGKYRAIWSVNGWATTGVVLMAVLFRSALLFMDVYPFNSDEAIVALMARHALQGSWPVFFYGQAYMGSLDATLVAVGFNFLGEHIWVIRLIQLILFTGILITSIRLSWRLSQSRVASLITGLLLAIPTVNLNLYTTISLGGYGEALLIGNIILLLTINIWERINVRYLYLIWGFIAGVGFWAFGLTLIYTVPAFLFLLIGGSRRDAQRGSYLWLILIMAGFIVGISPILYWVSRNGVSALVAELFGSALAGTSGLGYWNTVLNHIVNFLLFGATATIGLRPPWDINIFFWPLAILVVVFWLAVLIQYLRVLRRKGRFNPLVRLLGAVSLFLLVGFVLTPFGGDPSGRYFLPLTVTLAILAGLLFKPENKWFPRWFAWALFVGVLVYQLSVNLEVAIKSKPGFSTQFDEVARIDHKHDEALINFLRDQGVTRGFTNYWVAYPLAFKSSEELIFIPRLPYHLDLRYTPRDNRYLPYNSLLEQSQQLAYITTNHDELNSMIRYRLRELNVTWREETIGDYEIFYYLSDTVLPEDIDDRFHP